MVTINENIRWYKPNDPYYYEVDNLPLIDLLNNDKSLRDAVQAIENANLVWASQTYVTDEIQSAVGNIGTIDLYGGTTTYNNVVAWVEGQQYLTSVLTKVGELIDVDAENPSDGDLLVWKANELNSEGTLGVWKSHYVEPATKTVFLQENYWIAGSQPDGAGAENFNKAYNMYTEFRAWQALKQSEGSLTNFVKHFSATLAEMGIPQGAKSILYNSGISMIGSASYDIAHYFFHKQGLQHSNDGSVANVMIQKIWGQGGSDTGQNWDTSDGQMYLQDPTKTEIEVYSNVSLANYQAPKSSAYPGVYFFVYGYTI